MPTDDWFIELNLDQLDKMMNSDPRKLHLWLHYVETNGRATPQLAEYVRDITNFIDVNFKTIIVIEKEWIAKSIIAWDGVYWQAKEFVLDEFVWPHLEEGGDPGHFFEFAV